MKINLEELQTKFEKALSELHPEREFKVALTSFLDRKPEELLSPVDVSFRVRASLKEKYPNQIAEEFWGEFAQIAEEQP